MHKNQDHRAARNFPVRRSIGFARASIELFIPFKIRNLQYGLLKSGIAKRFIAEANSIYGNALSCFNIFELMEHFGQGWRMYYAPRGKTLIVMVLR